MQAVNRRVFLHKRCFKIKILQYAYRRIAQIPFKKLDVLIVDEIGKEISGGGADPNITGRFPNPITKEIAVQATCCAYLSLTKETNGNACGVGLADITTQRLFDQIDFAKTYPNSITSTLLHPSKIPIVMKNDYDAMRLALLCLPLPGPEQSKDRAHCEYRAAE